MVVRDPAYRVETRGRIFVGGNYDFMPTLRKIADFVKEASTDDRQFKPIIPGDDPEIGERETIKQDLIMNWSGFVEMWPASP